MVIDDVEASQQCDTLFLIILRTFLLSASAVSARASAASIFWPRMAKR